MVKLKKICVVTGTRAEYGLLRPIIEKIENDKDLELALVVTGMHLSPEFGLTYKMIQEDGFIIDEKIEILMSSDTGIGTAKSMGLAMLSFGECFERIKPDLIVLLGDRYEIFTVASVATVLNIPIAHLHGGEVTEGAYDDAFRHSITKMSYLHFTSNEQHRNRVIQLGESPERVFDVGAIGIENIRKLKLMDKDELEKSIDFKLDKNFGLLTFHPVTLENSTSEEQFKELLKAIDKYKNMKFIITKANSDDDGRVINKLIDKYVSENRDRSISFISMGQLRYLSAMKYCSLVIGNSSSGIIEAPSFNIPTINIGDRQKGRLQAKTVINCEPKRESIERAMEIALSNDFKESIKFVPNPYEKDNTSDCIIKVIKETLSKDISIKKSFYDVKF